MTDSEYEDEKKNEPPPTTTEAWQAFNVLDRTLEQKGGEKEYYVLVIKS